VAPKNRVACGQTVLAMASSAMMDWSPSASLSKPTTVPVGESVSKASSRLPSLDGWRGVAIIMVLLSHIVFAKDFPVEFRKSVDFTFDGNLGVRFFFTISGFIITWLLLKEYQKYGRISLKNFYLRRSLRILPVYFGYLLLVFILQLAGRCDVTWTGWLGVLTFTRNFIGQGGSPMDHFWSLCIEEQFYVLWPVTLFVILPRIKLKQIVIITLLVITLSSIARLMPITLGNRSLLEILTGAYSFFRYADCLMIGCAAAFFNREGIRVVSGAWSILGYLMVLWLKLLEVTDCANFWSYILGTPLQSIGFAIVMTRSMHPSTWEYRILNLRLMVWVGVLSYSLYVWHFIFLVHFAPGAMPAILVGNWYIWLVPATVLSLLSWFFIERPMMNLRSRFRSK
jgi:peptidoglycan/LPS O-acetylase OafA/YrhL